MEERGTILAVADDGWFPRIHFNELHLLARIVFSMGAVIFVASVITRDLAASLLGGAIVFLGLLYNYIVVLFGIGYEESAKASPKWKTSYVLNPIVALLLAGTCLYCSASVYLHGSLPFGLRPVCQTSPETRARFP